MAAAFSLPCALAATSVKALFSTEATATRPLISLTEHKKRFLAGSEEVSPRFTFVATRSFSMNKGEFHVSAVAVPQTTDAPMPTKAAGVIRKNAEELYRATQRAVCKGLEECDGEAKFRADSWDRPGGGGGVSCVLTDGKVFEKAGVNVSVVHGSMSPLALRQASPAMAQRLDGLQVADKLPFFATGISSVIHPWNPHAPTMHFNYRYFELCSEDGSPLLWWFGGGQDLTPSYLYKEDAVHFHQTLKDACDKHDPQYYPRFKKWADEYFNIAHRQETRGIGGIFFDDLNDREPEKILAFQQSCAEQICNAYVPIINRRKELPHTEEEKQWQQLRRGRYVEFNLVYDRGTQFGLRTSGRTESILMSLPLTARWEYDHHPAAGSREEELLKACQHPVDWL
mmetsp:Transcript_20608/g.33950  ORF Transcript_20608/g.33950 Transcript_20608/m.33950 type:complete len:398 (+) Transcript_20608:94-1287(+)